MNFSFVAKTAAHQKITVDGRNITALQGHLVCSNTSLCTSHYSLQVPIVALLRSLTCMLYTDSTIYIKPCLIQNFNVQWFVKLVATSSIFIRIKI